MKRSNKTLRRKRQQRQRSSRRSRRRQTRRQKGGSLPVPAGAVVAVSSKGEYGVPLLMTREKFEEEGESLED